MNDAIMEAIKKALEGVVYGECVGYRLEFRQPNGDTFFCTGGSILNAGYEEAEDES